MNELELTGISGTNPVGAMAAFGLLRILHIGEAFGRVALSWGFSDDWKPILHFQRAGDGDAVVDWLVERQRGRSEAAFLTWDTDVKVAPADYREQIQSHIEALSQDAAPNTPIARETGDFLVAFGSDVVVARSTGDVKPTAFHMTAGQQRFLKAGRELAASIDAGLTARQQTSEQRIRDCRNALREALFGPWKYQDKIHSLGWDPTTEGLYALSDISPSEAKPRSVPAAVWLAFESLPLFPTLPVRGRRAQELALSTLGFDSDDCFTWPIWSSPLQLDSLRSLLASSELAARELDEWRLKTRGIEAIFKSRCIRDGNGRGTFRNAVRAFG